MKALERDLTKAKEAVGRLQGEKKQLEEKLNKAKSETEEEAKRQWQTEKDNLEVSVKEQ